MHLEADEFRHAKPATVGEFEHRTIAESARIFDVDRIDKMFDVEPRERTREFARMRPQLYCRRRVTLDDLLIDQFARETAEAREMPALRADRESTIRERLEVCGQCARVERELAPSQLDAPGLKDPEIVGVRFHRMRTKTSLDRMAIQMLVDQ